jgi:hypothetical protein
MTSGTAFIGVQNLDYIGMKPVFIVQLANTLLLPRVLFQRNYQIFLSRHSLLY